MIKKEAFLGVVVVAGLTVSSGSNDVMAEESKTHKVLGPPIVESVPDWVDEIRLPEIPIQIPPQKRYMPNRIEISSVGIKEDFIYKRRFEENIGRYSTPDQGLATPSDDVMNFKNKIFIYGHSNWGGEEGIFHTLENIEIGDEVIVNAPEVVNGKFIVQEDKKYYVDSIQIVDDKTGVDILYGDDVPVVPTVMLLTSFREPGANKILLDKEKIVRKAILNVDNGVDDADYLYLLVTATPTQKK